MDMPSLRPPWIGPRYGILCNTRKSESLPKTIVQKKSGDVQGCESGVQMINLLNPGLQDLCFPGLSALLSAD